VAKLLWKPTALRIMIQNVAISGATELGGIDGRVYEGVVQTCSHEIELRAKMGSAPMTTVPFQTCSNSLKSPQSAKNRAFSPAKTLRTRLAHGQCSRRLTGSTVSVGIVRRAPRLPNTATLLGGGSQHAVALDLPYVHHAPPCPKTRHTAVFGECLKRSTYTDQ
jgi:hypothetical protein